MGIIADEDEVLDLVNGEEKVVGTITHAEAYDIANLHGNNLRAANAFIVNSEGKLWIPTRTAHKRIAPNGLDYSAGEHAQAGEPYITAIVRGFAEELNITARPEDFVYVGKSLPTPEVPYFAAEYLYFSDDVPSYNPDDFVGYAWLTPEELIVKLEAGTTAKKMLLEDAKHVLAYMNEHERNQ